MRILRVIATLLVLTLSLGATQRAVAAGVTCELNVTPSTIAPGKRATLSWTSTNATSGKIELGSGTAPALMPGTMTPEPNTPSADPGQDPLRPPPSGQDAPPLTPATEPVPRLKPPQRVEYPRRQIGLPLTTYGQAEYPRRHIGLPLTTPGQAEHPLRPIELPLTTSGQAEHPLGPIGLPLTPSGQMEVRVLATITYVGTFTGSAGSATCSTTLSVRP